MPHVDSILYLDKGKQVFYGNYQALQENDVIDIKAILETKEKKAETEGLKITLKNGKKENATAVAPPKAKGGANLIHK